MILLLLLAHSWYPHECCDDRHCRQVPCVEVKRYGEVWKWWSYEFANPRPSPDGRCHVCVSEGAAFCLFIPQVSS